jgi:hypothetical protein
MKKLFAIPDPEFDQRCLKNNFFNVILSDDATRDEAEEAARETTFDKLSELVKVVEDVKKKLHKRK